MTLDLQAGAMLGDAFLHQLPHAFSMEESDSFCSNDSFCSLVFFFVLSLKVAGGEHSHSHDEPMDNAHHHGHSGHEHSHSHSLKDLSVGLAILGKARNRNPFIHALFVNFNCMPAFYINLYI